MRPAALPSAVHRETKAPAANRSRAKRSERLPAEHRSASRHLMKALRAHPLRALEVALGLCVVALLATSGRIVIDVWLNAVGGALVSLPALLRVDGAATAWTLGVSLARIGLAILPSLVLLRSLPWYRRLWLAPLLALLVIISTPLSFTACASLDRWLLLAFLSAVGVALARRRFLGWTIVLPFAVLWEVVPSHGLLNFQTVGTEDRAYRERLLVQCAQRPGILPRNLTADHLMPYHGINPLNDDLLFIGGEGPEDGGMRGHSGGRRVGSWWLRRNDGAFEFELFSKAHGNFWRGCVLDGTLWMARGHRLIGSKRQPDAGGDERLLEISVPSTDMDFLDTECDPDRGRVYLTEYVKGGLWEVVPGNGEPIRHQIGGGMLLPRRRPDGRLLLSNSAELMVFVPGEDRVVERVPIGLAVLGFDICPVDGSIAVGDLTGRLRIFERDRDRRYRFAWGVGVFAPRRIAYARDCSRIAVTSADDHRLFIVDPAERRVIETLPAGPALREVAVTGPREFSITDVCTLTSYRW